MIKALYDMAMNSLKVSHHANRFGGHRHFGSGDLIVLAYHVILQDYVIKGLYDFMVRSQSRQLTTYWKVSWS